MLTKSIYKIENLINGKIYIGQSVHPYRRFVEHIYKAKHELDSAPIHLALKKYGKENFSFDIIESSVEDYNEREIYWIQQYNCIAPNGYNILIGGQANPVLKGEEHPRNTLTNHQVDEIIELLLFSNLSQRQIAEQLSTTERIVNSINKGETHRIEKQDYPLREKFCHFSRQTLDEIYWLLANSDASLISIASYYGLTKGNISQINLGKTHKKDIAYPIRQNTGEPRNYQEITTFLLQKEKEDVNANQRT